jgi:hypothetical protein
MRAARVHRADGQCYCRQKSKTRTLNSPPEHSPSGFERRLVAERTRDGINAAHHIAIDGFNSTRTAENSLEKLKRLEILGAGPALGVASGVFCRCRPIIEPSNGKGEYSE